MGNIFQPTRRTTLIATVLNEGQSIHHLMSGILAQTTLPDEIVIVDGGSQDNTIELVQSYADRLPIRLLQESGCNISRGRNTAIQAATGEVIAATDAGVRLPETWFQNIIAPLQQGADAAAGFFYPDPAPHDAFQVAMSATVLPRLDEIEPTQFLPSSRSVAFSKQAWQAVGGYPEWLDYSEDLIFDLRLKEKTKGFVFVPQAYVWFKPRTTLKGFFKQYYRYARGDGKADLWRKRHAVRYITYVVIVPIIALSSVLVHPLFALLYGLGAAVYLRQPYRRLSHLWHTLNPKQRLIAAGYVPIIRVWGDVAKMIGYPVGVIWRWRHKPPNWRED